MQKFQDVILDQYGNVVQAASVIVYNTGTLVKPTIYSDNGSTITANPLTTDTLGRYYFYAAAGRYDLAISGSKITSYTETDVCLQDSTADLAASSGSSLVGFTEGGTGAVLRTTQDKLREEIDLMDFVPDAYKSAIRAFTSTQDLDTYFDSALTEISSRKGRLILPRGLFNLSANHYYTYNDTEITGHGMGGSILNFTGASNSIQLTSSAAGDFGMGKGTYYNFGAASSGALTITTTTAADAGNFAVDEWVYLRSNHNSSGVATKPKYWEYIRVKSVNAGTGVITFYTPLARSYDNSDGAGYLPEIAKLNGSVARNIGFSHMTVKGVSSLRFTGNPLFANFHHLELLSNELNNGNAFSIGGGWFDINSCRFGPGFSVQIDSGQGSYFHSYANNLHEASTNGAVWLEEGTYGSSIKDSTMLGGQTAGQYLIRLDSNGQVGAVIDHCTLIGQGAAALAVGMLLDGSLVKCIDCTLNGFVRGIDMQTALTDSVVRDHTFVNVTTPLSGTPTRTVQSGNRSATTTLPTLNQVTMSDGTSAAPCLTWSSDTTTGVYRAGSARMGFLTGGGSAFEVGLINGGSVAGLGMRGDQPICWTGTTSGVINTNPDTFLYRDGAPNTIAQKDTNGTADQITRRYGKNGGYWERGTATELLTLSTVGTTTDTVANLLPANSIIEAVTARVTTNITTATDWKLGDATISGRFAAANAVMTAGSNSIGTVQADQTGTSGPRQTAAAKVRVTTTGTPGAGVIRITVFYRSFVAPTS